MKAILLILLTISFLGCTDKIDKNGFFIEGKNIGLNKATKSKYDVFGYNKDGYNSLGYNKEQFNKDGYNKEGFTKEGFNARGYDKNGYTKEGFNARGYDKNGYNKEGFNARGYDKNGYNKEGIKVKIFELKRKVGESTHIMQGEFSEMKNLIIINHISSSRPNVREEWEEYFEIEKNENGYILTKKNENKEYFELNLNSKSFYYKDKEGVIPGYVLNL